MICFGEVVSPIFFIFFVTVAPFSGNTMVEIGFTNFEECSLRAEGDCRWTVAEAQGYAQAGGGGTDGQVVTSLMASGHATLRASHPTGEALTNPL